MATLTERWLAAFLLCGALLCGAVQIGVGSWLAPFAWPDVAVVHGICAFPSAFLLGSWVRRRWSVSALLALAAFSYVLAAVLLLMPSFAGFLQRSSSAFGIEFACTLLVLILVPRPAVARPPSVGALAVAALVWLLLPWSYVASRCQHDATQLAELLAQSRLGEALQRARGLLVLDPGRAGLTQTANQLERRISDLQLRVADPLRAGAPPRLRLERARQLAMLGRTDAALTELNTIDDVSAAFPMATNLRGTILEARGDWQNALIAFTHARAAWKGGTPSAQRTAELVHAVKGMAYCQRKLGQYAEAEATYEELLNLAPTADSHFLLAQFYEDSQRVKLAEEHARRAMALAPEQYQTAGENLIAKLAVYHFGCLTLQRSP